jgi:hypothetical protein
VRSSWWSEKVAANQLDLKGHEELRTEEIVAARRRDMDSQEKKKRKRLTRDDISLIGSYASFLGLLLIATLLDIRYTFEELIAPNAAGAPGTANDAVAIISLLLFGLTFLLIPFIPIAHSIVGAFREGHRYLALILTYMLFIYIVVIIYQYFFETLDRL